MKHTLLAAIFGGATLQVLAQAPTPATQRMEEHIVFLADDALEGRETGMKGEAMAADYIIAQMKDIGLQPAGEEGGWQQPFDFLAERRLGKAVSMAKGKMMLVPGKDYEVFSYSGDGQVMANCVDVGFGIHAPQLNHDDYKGKDVKDKIAVIRRGNPDPSNPHSGLEELSGIAAKAEVAKRFGAVAVIFVDPADQELEPPFLGFSRRMSRMELPVVYGKHEAAYFAGGLASISVEIEEVRRTGHNVVGKFDNGARHWVIIGAHYDHLGMGGDGSLHRGEPGIHNGADDNASGTGMLIELAREIKARGWTNYNYLFIAFSGEEKGLLGSNYYAKNPTIELENATCMLNMDMVGRLDEEKQTLGVNGYGTSPFWAEALPAIQIEGLKTKTAESGVGPSDHTSFYLKDIPVLHFFSGTHEDYHKPSDDEELINYPGMDKIFRYILAVIEKVEGEKGKLAFSQTKNEQESVPRWKVTLGVVPDYMYDGEGMRIDGVSEGRPAANAKLKTGDVVIRMGDYEVRDMMGYMQALSKFDKGETVKVTVLRKGKEKTKKVTF